MAQVKLKFIHSSQAKLWLGQTYVVVNWGWVKHEIGQTLTRSNSGWVNMDYVKLILCQTLPKIISNLAQVRLKLAEGYVKHRQGQIWIRSNSGQVKLKYGQHLFRSKSWVVETQVRLNSCQVKHGSGQTKFWSNLSQFTQVKSNLSWFRLESGQFKLMLCQIMVR